MAPTASAKVEIAAPPTAVWAILMDFERYPDWNPFIIKISGDQKGSSSFYADLGSAFNAVAQWAADLP